ncbi:MAG: hypothetical protein H6R10_1228 [Rhodocyclaceae bacterium]|nr:hypothetical protein [Rhodocyclaceae bacterium]
MTAPLPSPARVSARFPLRAKLCALALGLALGGALPALADDLPDVQRLVKQGQYAQALGKVDAYLSGKPKDAQGRFLKGLILTEMGKPAEAVAVFTKLTEDYPELPEPYNNLAVLYAQQKQYDKARTALEMAIRTHPSYAIAYENLGDVYAKLASQAYDKALQLDSSNSSTQNKLSLIRDLISTPARANVRPQPPAAPLAAAPAAKPQPAATPAPTAAIIAATPGAASAAALAKPADPKPAAPKTDPAADDIVKTLNNWVEAWSRKDVKAYLAHYAADFRTPKGMSRKAWEAERQDRIAGKAGKISVSYEQPQVTVNGDKATAKFRQRYKAGSLNTSTTKTLVFVRSAGKWLIQEENSR